MSPDYLNCLQWREFGHVELCILSRWTRNWEYQRAILWDRMFDFGKLVFELKRFEMINEVIANDFDVNNHCKYLDEQSKARLSWICWQLVGCHSKVRPLVWSNLDEVRLLMIEHPLFVSSFELLVHYCRVQEIFCKKKIVDWKEVKRRKQYSYPSV